MEELLLLRSCKLAVKKLMLGGELRRNRLFSIGLCAVSGVILLLGAKDSGCRVGRLLRKRLLLCVESIPLVCVCLSSC